MYFRKIYDVPSLMLNLRDREVKFECGGQYNISIVLSSKAEQWGIKKKVGPHICVATADTEPTKKAMASLDAITRNHEEIGGPLLSFAMDVCAALREQSLRVLRILRWRLDIDTDHVPIGGSLAGLQWSRDGAQWLSFSMPGNIAIGIMRVISGQVELYRNEAMKLLQAGESEPIHHPIFLEAWSQRHNNQRSALIIGIASAEIGVKSFISIAAPATRWFLESQQAPPMLSLLKDYLPTILDEKHRSMLPPSSMLDTLRKGVTIRNDLTHRAAESPGHEIVGRVLLAVRDLLWLLDSYRGFEWALEHISDETRDEMSKKQG